MPIPLLAAALPYLIPALVQGGIGLWSANKNAQQAKALNAKSEEQWNKEFGLQEQQFGLNKEQFGFNKAATNAGFKRQSAQDMANMLQGFANNDVALKNNLVSIFRNNGGR